MTMTMNATQNRGRGPAKRLTGAAMPAMALAMAMVASLGCVPGAADSEHTVVVYTSVDEPYAKALAAAFNAHEREAAARGEIAVAATVALKTDSELEKTVGLANLVLEQKAAPRADVWWSGEPSQTVRLHRAGAFATYQSPHASARDAEFRGSSGNDDPTGTWTMLALRLRVIVRHREGPQWPADVPKTVAALPEALRRIQSHTPAGGRVLAFADPRFGTTNTHIAAMVQIWGEARTREWLRELRELGCVPAGGNMQVVDAVAQRSAVWGFTDTDDVFAAQAENKAVEMIVLKETLAIPSTVAVIANARREAIARRFVDFLLSPKGEAVLAQTAAKFLPVRADVSPPQEFPPVADVRPLPVRWAEIDSALNAGNAIITEIWPSN